MVAISPFCALRYDPGRVGELSRVIAPPYDVIDAEEQARLYDASPYNIVRLILGKELPTDGTEDNRYTRARREFEAWRGANVLRQDSTPAIYLIEQTFEDGGVSRSRLGFIALLQFSESIERWVFRHEATLAAPKEDRTRLLDAVPANLSPVFCIHPDEGETIQAILRRVTEQEPPVATATLHDEPLRLWTITAPSLIEQITQRLASLAVLIADGHHRFEVAFANRQRYGAVMAYFVSMADPGLRIRPIHRIVRAQPPGLDALRALCVVEPAADAASLMPWLEDPAQRGRFGYSDGRTLYRLSLKPESLARWLMAPSVPLPVATLDVSMLHNLVLPSLGVNGSRIAYTASAAEALDAVKDSPGSCVWLLRAIPLPQVYALAAQGFTLPPKSTYFYPKVPSGLTLNAFS
jgi:uncharacterized protein (DUF1015 family)